MSESIREIVAALFGELGDPMNGEPADAEVIGLGQSENCGGPCCGGGKIRPPHNPA